MADATGFEPGSPTTGVGVLPFTPAPRMNLGNHAFAKPLFSGYGRTVPRTPECSFAAAIKWCGAHRTETLWGFHMGGRFAFGIAPRPLTTFECLEPGLNQRPRNYEFHALTD